MITRHVKQIIDYLLDSKFGAAITFLTRFVLNNNITALLICRDQLFKAIELYESGGKNLKNLAAILRAHIALICVWRMLFKRCYNNKQQLEIENFLLLVNKYIQSLFRLCESLTELTKQQENQLLITIAALDTTLFWELDRYGLAAIDNRNVSAQKNIFIINLLLAPSLVIIIQRNFPFNGSAVNYRAFVAWLVIMLTQYAIETEILFQLLQPLEIAFLQPDFSSYFSKDSFIKKYSALESAGDSIINILGTLPIKSNSAATKPLLFSTASTSDFTCEQHTSKLKNKL